MLSPKEAFEVVEDEIAFVRRRAAQLAPGEFMSHLRSKGFASPEFLSRWAALTKLLNSFGQIRRALDLGVGPGWSSIFLALRGVSVVGIDVSPDMIDAARENAARFGVEVDFRCGDMREPVGDGPFDLVLVIDALHHCADDTDLVVSAFEALRPGGRFVMSEPAWFHRWSPKAREEHTECATRERGMFFYRVRRSLKTAGFVDIRRHYECWELSGASPLARVATFGKVAATLTIGYPGRPLVVTAMKPGPANVP